jgi:pyridoxamine 5'-phosphate oxidase
MSDEDGKTSADGGFRDEDPIAWLRDSLARAAPTESFDPARAALATVTSQGIPAVRFVLVKVVDERGLAFFTNLTSAKADDLATVAHAALAFHWASIGEQVRVSGPVTRVSDDEASAYFATRPRGSQLSAWASAQSAPIDTRSALEASARDAQARFRDGDVPRPEFWGGYRIAPNRIEFWRNRDDRLHDRWLFTRTDARWTWKRLQP